ncbi:MAG: carboxypeptidase regulatory-like domain-containing protein [bacterium]|nr:carboxypeptidase regulatory-like domain-containing protein [bacterium]
MMKKVVLATGGLAVPVAGLWNAGGGGGSEEAGARPMHRPQRAKLEALGGGHAAEAGATRAPEREAIAPPAAEPTPDPKPDPILDLAALTVVVWSDGERVADEVVVLRHYGAGNFWPERIQRTGPDGATRFTDVPHGPVGVSLLRGAQSDLQLAPGADEAIELALFRGLSVRGTVVDGDGDPIADARVQVSERWRTDSAHVVARTDRDGRFELESVGTNQTVSAYTAEHAPSRAFGVSGAEGDVVQLRIPLPRTATHLAGTVVDGSGQPVPGAEVRAGEDADRVRVRLADGGESSGPPTRRTRCDAEGRFRLEAVPLGLQPLRARAPGFAPVRVEVDVAAAAAPLVLVLARPATIEGTIAAPDGTPLAGVRVFTPEHDSFRAAAAYSGGDGTFRLEGLPPGALRVVARSDLGEAEWEGVLVAGAVVAWSPRIEPSPAIFGTLTDAEGEPLAGWIVHASVGADRSRSRRARADASGRYHLSRLEDAGYVLQVQAPRDGWRVFPYLIERGVRPAATPHDLQLTPDAVRAGSITATILGPGGRPVAGAALDIWHDTQRLWRRLPADPKTGEVVVERVPPGACSLTASAAEHPSVALGEREVQMGEQLDLGRIELAEAGRITGELVAKDGASFEDLTIRVVDAEGRDAGQVRREGRRYSSAALAAGAVELQVQGDFVAPVRIPCDVRANETSTVDVELVSAPMREVQFKPSAAAMPRYLWCLVQTPDGQEVWRAGGLRSNGGVFVARVSLPAGSYVVFAGSPATGNHSLPLQIRDVAGAQEPLVVDWTQK